jgi:type IV secretory pathway VirB10-like protein
MFLGYLGQEPSTGGVYARNMANNIFLSLGIVGILGTGSAAVVANTQSLTEQEQSPLLDASEILLPTDGDAGITVPPLEAPTPLEDVLPADSATPDDAQAAPAPAAPAPAPAPAPEPAPEPVATPAAPAPVDATSGGSGYYEEEEDDDHDDDDDDDDHGDDDEDDDDDDHDEDDD